MLNIKWGGIAAGAAFVLALVLSLLLGQTSLPIALLRAVVFAALFFGLGTVAWLLISTFIPDLLSPIGTGDIASNLFSTESAGSRVNITVDDEHSAALPTALPEQNYGVPGSDHVDDFNNLFSPKDIDQTPATGYTTEGGETEDFLPATEEFSSAFNETGPNDGEDTGAFSMDFSAFVPNDLGDGETSEAGGTGETDESDSDLDAFSFFPDTTGSGLFEEPAVPERKVSRNKSQKLEGDFDAREIAAGLRTVLEKDKK